MEKINGRNVLILLLILLLTACQSYKKVPYLQDAEVVLYSKQKTAYEIRLSLVGS